MVTGVTDAAGLLIVEDDQRMAASLDDALRFEGYRTWVAHTGVEALETLSAHGDGIDVMLLDRDLPAMSGDAVLGTVRRMGLDVRVLMVTAAGSVEQRVEGLDLGADDYLAKPFAFAELAARIRALLRRDGDRNGGGDVATANATGAPASDFRIDASRRLAHWRGVPLDLTVKEFDALACLLAAHGGWVGVAELARAAWPDGSPSAGAVKTLVYTLRRKLEDAGADHAVESGRGKGYRIP